MDRFRQVGVRVALDDFGSQYANFSIFTHVKFDCVKLDRTLISDLTVNRRTQMLVRDLEEICHSTDIYTILKNASGIDFTYYKRATILRRIERRMLVTHSASLADFARLLGDSSEEVQILTKEILISVTKFFRDPPFFEKLKYHAIHKIVERVKEGEPICVWSAGCSTGEEAYSIAILFQEVMEELQVQRDVKIFATDVDSRAIEQAGKGIFSENIIDDVTPDRLARFFLKQNDQYLISKQIRRMIVFAPHNMFSDPPFGKLDLISCRNVMIYFQPVLQRGLFAIFHSALKHNGYLFLGKSETASEYANLFKPVCGPEKIYVHKGEGKVEDLTPPSFNLPNMQAISLKSRQALRNPGEIPGGEAAYTRFLETFLPASVVLDAQDAVVHFFGNYADYFALAPGGNAELFQHHPSRSGSGGRHSVKPLPGDPWIGDLYRYHRRQLQRAKDSGFPGAAGAGSVRGGKYLDGGSGAGAPQAGGRRYYGKIRY